MTKYSYLLIFFFLLFIISCSPDEDPDLEDKWRLVSVDRLSYPVTSPNKVIFYPSEPQESDLPIFSYDSNYQEWSWKDSCRIEFAIIYDNEITKLNKSIEYSLVNDTIYFDNSRYGFEIINNDLFLNGWGESNLGIDQFLYHFILVE